jgi:predicted NodU family carbamoyl transferase
MPDKPYTLGLSGLRSGFAVSLFRHDSLEFAIEEDKLSRAKGVGLADGAVRESRAIDAALRYVKGGPDQIERVVYTPDLDARVAQVDNERAFLSNLLDRFHSISADIQTVDHVRAQMAFARSVDPDADAVLMVGKSQTSVGLDFGTAEVSNSSRFDVVTSIEDCLGFLGLHAGQIHHLENMAQSGEPVFADTIAGVVEDASARPSMTEALERALDLPRRPRGQAVTPKHFDVAASIHEVLSGRIRGVVASALESRKSLALCGGVFNSWRLNDRLASWFPDSSLSVSFAPGNASCAVGGPMTLNRDRLKHRPSPFLGPSYTRDEVKGVLDNCKTRYAFHPLTEIMDQVSTALGEGKMVGWFGGRCEFGLRALGARSVFTNPANPYACDNLSSFLKKRPSYMSYAVVMREEDASVPSPFMSRSIRLPEYFGDNPVRLQTVSRQMSPTLHHLLGQFNDRFGVPALLNTSLNYFDEPIACSPRDAVKTFFASGLDAVVMENFLLTKN